MFGFFSPPSFKNSKESTGSNIQWAMWLLISQSNCSVTSSSLWQALVSAVCHQAVQRVTDLCLKDWDRRSLAERGEGLCWRRAASFTKVGYPRPRYAMCYADIERFQYQSGLFGVAHARHF